MKNIKNIKYLSIALLLSGFTVNGTRGALTQDQSIASEVTNSPDTTIAESSVQNQQDINTKFSEQPATVNVGTTQKVIQPTSEVVFQADKAALNDKLTTDTTSKPEVLSVNIEGENGDAQEKVNIARATDLVTTETQQSIETKTVITGPVIDETQKTFAQEAEEKAEEKLAEEVVAKEPVKQEVTEEEMVFNPEEKNIEQNIVEKTNAKELKKKSAAKAILAEEKNKDEKKLEDEGINSYYIEEDEVETTADEPQELEIDAEDAAKLIG